MFKSDHVLRLVNQNLGVQPQFVFFCLVFFKMTTTRKIKIIITLSLWKFLSDAPRFAVLPCSMRSALRYRGKTTHR